MLMTVFPPALLETLKVLPVILKDTGSPALIPTVSVCAIVIVERPDTGAVTELNPAKFMLVTAAPTELPPNCSSRVFEFRTLYATYLSSEKGRYRRPT